MGRRSFAVGVLAAGAAFTAGCSAPEVPVHVGVREVQTDVVIDRDDAASAAGDPTTTTTP